MTELVVATSNGGKLREIKNLLAAKNWNIHAQGDYGISEIAETGLTFVENAILKARHTCKHTGLATIADDSGLETDALNGQPGIYSARYAGDKANDNDNILKLLTELEQIKDAQRTARFHCVMVYLRHPEDPTPVICQGTWNGVICHQPQGNNGFGYDPIFYLPEYACTAAELPLESKNQLSHRGQALATLTAQLING